MKVIKTRGRRYHVDEDCRALENANKKWIDKETAEAWNLDPCCKCAGEQDNSVTSKWNKFVADCRNP